MSKMNEDDSESPLYTMESFLKLRNGPFRIGEISLNDNVVVIFKAVKLSNSAWKLEILGGIEYVKKHIREQGVEKLIMTMADCSPELLKILVA